MTNLIVQLIYTSRRILIILFAILTINGCAGTSVLFNKEVTGKLKVKSGEEVYRVFFDREGYIYPDKTGENQVHIVTAEFNNGPGKGHLQRYFCEHPEQLKKVAAQAGIQNYHQYECDLNENAKEGYSGAITYKDSSPEQNKWLDQWEDIQEGLLNKQSQSIAEELQKEENVDRPLFVLIHGYNNNLDRVKEAYDEVRRTLKKIKNIKI